MSGLTKSWINELKMRYWEGPLGKAFSTMGYDKLQALRDFPLILSKGNVWKTPTMLIYQLDAIFWNPPGPPNKNKFIAKLLQVLSYLFDLFKENVYHVNWHARVKSRQRLPKQFIPLFFVKNILVMWRYELAPEEPFNQDKTLVPFRIEVLFSSDLHVEDFYLAKDLVPESMVNVLCLFYRDSQRFVNSLIENYLLNKNTDDKDSLKNKAWDYLKSRGLIKNDKLQGSLSDIRKAIQDALKRPPKRKSQPSLKQCLICGKDFNRRGSLCSHCYKKRWFAIQLLEKLAEDKLGEHFSKGLLTETEKQHIVEAIRPAGSRYAFSYFEKCLRELLAANKAKNWPDKKFKEKIEKFSFLRV